MALQPTGLFGLVCLTQDLVGPKIQLLSSESVDSPSVRSIFTLYAFSTDVEHQVEE